MEYTYRESLLSFILKLQGNRLSNRRKNTIWKEKIEVHMEKDHVLSYLALLHINIHKKRLESRGPL